MVLFNPTYNIVIEMAMEIKRFKAHNMNSIKQHKFVKKTYLFRMWQAEKY